MKLHFPNITAVFLFGICFLVIFFGPFNIWWDILLLLGIGIFIIGMATFVIYAASKALDFIHKVDNKNNKKLSKD